MIIHGIIFAAPGFQILEYQLVVTGPAKTGYVFTYYTCSDIGDSLGTSSINTWLNCWLMCTAII